LTTRANLQHNLGGLNTKFLWRGEEATKNEKKTGRGGDISGFYPNKDACKNNSTVTASGLRGDAAGKGSRREGKDSSMNGVGFWGGLFGFLYREPCGNQGVIGGGRKLQKGRHVRRKSGMGEKEKEKDCLVEKKTRVWWGKRMTYG